ncbi:MAG TPA: hypothetical protein VFR67_04105 [Pilimelia sp.]|nr:hypothetical protein [Pilimelia sp.]
MSMARTGYLTGFEPGSGKSAVALGIAEVLSRRVERLGCSARSSTTPPNR